MVDRWRWSAQQVRVFASPEHETSLAGLESIAMSEDSEPSFLNYNTESKVRLRIGSVHAPRSGCGRDPA